MPVDKPYFSYLTDIADAIRYKEGSSDPIVASTFADRIRALPSSGGGGGSNLGFLDSPLDPEEVYKETRPKDWLPLPMPNEQEGYFLLHIPKEEGTGIWCFYLHNSGGANFEYDYGTVTDGEFVSMHHESVPTDTNVELVLNYADFPDHITSDGMAQVMIKVVGTKVTGFWPNNRYSAYSSPEVTRWRIVDLAINMPDITSMDYRFGGDSEYTSLSYLRYARIVKSFPLARPARMFAYCYNLITVIGDLNFPTSTDAHNFFYRCNSLLALPDISLDLVTNIDEFFSDCSSLISIKSFLAPSATDASGLFAECGDLEVIGDIDISNVSGDVRQMFYAAYSLASDDFDVAKLVKKPGAFVLADSLFQDCRNVRIIRNLDLSAATGGGRVFYECTGLEEILNLKLNSGISISDMFYRCNNLRRLTFAPDQEPAGYSLNLDPCNFQLEGIREMFESLPEGDSHSISLANSPGMINIPEDVLAIATNKGWRIS